MVGARAGRPLDAKPRSCCAVEFDDVGKPRCCHLARGRDGRLVATWACDDDLWMAASDDLGDSWSGPRLLPVPVNSAHSEGDPSLGQLPDGELDAAVHVRPVHPTPTGSVCLLVMGLEPMEQPASDPRLLWRPAGARGLAQRWPSASCLARRPGGHAGDVFTAGDDGPPPGHHLL